LNFREDRAPCDLGIRSLLCFAHFNVWNEREYSDGVVAVDGPARPVVCYYLLRQAACPLSTQGGLDIRAMRPPLEAARFRRTEHVDIDGAETVVQPPRFLDRRDG
jgi:hypothetical protein